MNRYDHSRCPIEHTCPDIDSIIKLLEKLRSANSELRELGNDEAKEVDKLNEENEKLQSKIDDLNSDIEYWKEEHYKLSIQL